MKELRKEDEEFERDAKQRYQDQKTKRRRARREWLKKQLKAKLDAMQEDEREDYLDRRAARRERLRDDEAVLLKEAIGKGKLDLYDCDEKEYKAYRKDLRRQIRAYRKDNDFDSSEDEDARGARNIEDKIYYGSDSISEDFSREPEHEREVRSVVKELTKEALNLEKENKLPKQAQQKTARYLQRLYDIYEEEVFQL